MDSQPELLCEFSSYLRLQGKRKATVDSYRQDAASFLLYLQAVTIPLQAVEPLILHHYQEHLASQKGKRNSIRRSLIGIRQFYRFLSDRKFIAFSPLEETPLPGRQEELGAILEMATVAQLIKASAHESSNLKAARDRAIISLLAFEGLKVSELIELNWSDFIVAHGLGSLRIHGQRSRIIQLRAETSTALEIYQHILKENHPLTRFPQLWSHMFISFKGRELLKPMANITRHGLKFMLYELGAEVGYPHLNSEMLRHFAVHFHLGLGRTPEEIMQHLGLKRLGNIGKHAHLLSATKASLKPIVASQAKAVSSAVVISKPFNQEV